MRIILTCGTSYNVSSDTTLNEIESVGTVDISESIKANIRGLDGWTVDEIANSIESDLTLYELSLYELMRMIRDNEIEIVAY